jgi:glycosyltransferase involved in cell wall biosynthesis
MLRILRITPHFYRPGRWPVAFDPVGGLQMQTWHLTLGLERAGASQTVVTSRIPGSPRRLRLSAATSVCCAGPGLPEYLAGSLLNPTWGIAAMAKILRLAGSHDLIHVHLNHSVWCRLIVLLSRALKRPLVVSMNTALWGGLRDALHLEGRALDLPMWIERAALGAADKVVALTETAAAEAVRQLRLDRDRIAVIPDAIDPDAFRSGVDAAALDRFRAEFGIPENSPVVSYVGRISPEKGSGELPHLIARLSESGVFTLICGDGPARQKLESALRRLPRGGWAITGFVEPETVKLALQASRAVMLPSRREAFGSVLLEAMASGVPAVAYDVGGIADVAGRPAAIALVPAGRRDLLLERLQALIEDSAARTAQIERGRRRVLDFTIGASVDATAALYEEVLSARRLLGQAADGAVRA